MSKYPEVILTEEQLDELCAEWQKRLRLQDWLVQVGIWRARDMRLDGQGECEWVLQKKMASIRITDPVDYPENRAFPQDMEWTLVHELLHLHFAPIYANVDDTSIHHAQEQAIDSIAQALVDLKRSETKAGKEIES